MKKHVALLMTAVLALGTAAGSAYAKQDNKTEKSNPKKAPAAAHAKGSNDESIKVKLDIRQTDDTVTGRTYEDKKEKETETRGGGGFHGLHNALQNVKDKPSGSVLAGLLLSKYGAQLSAELQAELEAIVEADRALALVAVSLEQQGSVTEAVYMQKEAVRANKKEISLYKKLGKLYEKAGRTGVKLYVNGEEPVFGAAPFIKNGATLVPFRAIAEALEAEVSWNPGERSVTVSRDGITVKLMIGSTTATINGEAVTLQVPAEIVNGTTVVPVRFVSEALKADVQWEPETQSVVINGETSVEVEASAPAEEEAETSVE